jgi:hypothetical protein
VRSSCPRLPRMNSRYSWMIQMTKQYYSNPELKSNKVDPCAQMIRSPTFSIRRTCWSKSINQILIHSRIVRFEIFMALTMKNAVFWDVAPCRSSVNRRFEETDRLHRRGRRIRERGTSVSRWLQTAICSFETSVHTRSTWRHVLEDGILHSRIVLKTLLQLHRTY